MKGVIYLGNSEFEDLAIFCGAGISKNSGLPLAGKLKQCILKKLLVEESDMNEIMNSNLPLEAFIEAISENTDVSKILQIFQKGEPNTNHILIAKLAKSGYLRTICTTNFDLLIERALEKEGLRENVDFERYYNEEDFSRIDFNKLSDKVKIFKIHGSIDDIESIRITMKAVASKTLSDKRMNVIKYLFSTGNHRKVLILGYSCSDEFDITPQIQSIEENQKEIIFVDHCEEGKEIEDIKIKEERNPFRKSPGKRIKCNTDHFIKELWDSLKGIGKYELIKSKIDSKIYIDSWATDLIPGLKFFIAGLMFTKISNFNKSIEFYDKSLEIASAVGDKTGEAGCYGNLGIAHYGLGDFNKAIEHYEKSLQLNIEIGNKGEESSCYANLGNAYLGLGDFRRAIGYFEKALEIDKAAGDKAGEAKCYGNLANAYFRSDLSKAIKFYGRSLKITKATGDKTGEAKCCGNLGNAYHGLGDFKKAIKYHEESLRIKKAVGDKAGEARCYVGLGNIYRSWGDFERALEYYKKSFEIAKEVGNKAMESSCHGDLGNVYYGLGDFKKAIEFYEKSLEIAKKIRDKLGEGTCYTNLGSAYGSLGDFKRAIEYFLDAEKTLEGIGQIYHLKVVYRNLALAYEKIGDNEKVEDYKRKLSGDVKIL